MKCDRDQEEVRTGQQYFCVECSGVFCCAECQAKHSCVLVNTLHRVRFQDVGVG